LITGTYKEEYGTGGKGWHIERGAPVKPTGGRILTIEYKRINTKNSGDVHLCQVDSCKFPL